MKRRILLLALLLGSASASAHRVVVDGGALHLRGELVNGACVVSPESQNLRVEMGQYRTNLFGEVGSYSSVTVPFSLTLQECRSDVSQQVGITFQGLTPAEDPQVFVASAQASGKPGTSGLGLALFDSRQQQILPNTAPARYLPIDRREMTFYFSARYRVISLPLIPGALRSDVWFTLAYP